MRSLFRRRRESLHRDYPRSLAKEQDAAYRSPRRQRRKVDDVKNLSVNISVLLIAVRHLPNSHPFTPLFFFPRPSSFPRPNQIEL